MIRKTAAAAVMLVISALSGILGISCYADNEVDFGYHADSEGLSVYIKKYEPSLQYSISLNGGKGFIPLYGKSGMHFSYLPDGTYQLCAMVTGERSTLSDVKAVRLGEDKENNINQIDISVTGIREKGYMDGVISVVINNFSIYCEYMISVNGGKTWLSCDGRETIIGGLPAGDYKVCVKNRFGSLQQSNEVEVTVPVMNYSDKAYISVPLIKQLPELPTGCEVTSLAMALRFYGINVKHTSLADSFLEKGEYRASDYRKVFVGNPREIKAYGCYSGVIVKTANKFLKTIPARSFDVIDLTGSEPDRLYSYADMGYPVIVWATSKMLPLTEGAQWTDKETGRNIVWKGNEHCMVLTGYDTQKGLAFFNDPQRGACAYNMELFEQRFKDMEKQAVVIVENAQK